MLLVVATWTYPLPYLPSCKNDLSQWDHYLPISEKIFLEKTGPDRPSLLSCSLPWTRIRAKALFLQVKPHARSLYLGSAWWGDLCLDSCQLAVVGHQRCSRGLCEVWPRGRHRRVFRHQWRLQLRRRWYNSGQTIRDRSDMGGWSDRWQSAFGDCWRLEYFGTCWLSRGGIGERSYIDGLVQNCSLLC